MRKVRCFIAVDMPPRVCSALGEVSSLLASQLTGGGVRWVKPSNIHLTLRFLGDTDPTVIENIISGLDRIASGCVPFKLSLRDLGCFPNSRRPRVIWVGLGGNTDRLAALYQALEHELQPLGWEPERRTFRPHLTLGRVKDTRQVVAANLPWGETLMSDDLDVTAISLIRSDLKPTGAVYTTLHESLLTGDGR